MHDAALKLASITDWECLSVLWCGRALSQLRVSQCAMVRKNFYLKKTSLLQDPVVEWLLSLSLVLQNRVRGIMSLYFHLFIQYFTHIYIWRSQIIRISKENFSKEKKHLADSYHMTSNIYKYIHTYIYMHI